MLGQPLTPSECKAAVRRHYDGLIAQGCARSSAIVVTATQLNMTTDRVLWCVTGYDREAQRVAVPA